MRYAKDCGESASKGLSQIVAVTPASRRLALVDRDGVSRVSWRGAVPQLTNHLDSAAYTPAP
jgi:hypothetical protein